MTAVFAMEDSGDFVKAVEGYDALLEGVPNNSMYLVRRARSHRLAGSYDKALADFDQAFEIDSTLRKSFAVERGLTLSSLGRYKQAIDDFSYALSEDPNDFAAMYNIAVSNVHSKSMTVEQVDLDSLRERLVTLTEIDETRYLALYGLGGLAALTGDSDQALDLLGQALHLSRHPAHLAPHDLAWFDLREDRRFLALIRSVDLGGTHEVIESDS